MPSAPRPAKTPAPQWTGPVSNALLPAIAKPVIKRVMLPELTPAIGCKPVRTDRTRPIERRPPTDKTPRIDRRPLTEPRLRTEAKGLPETIRRISSRENRPLRQISDRATRRRVNRRKTGLPRQPPARAVPATMPSPARALRPRSTHKPVVAGPARHPPSAPVPREPPAIRSVGRPIHQRVKVKGVAVVE